MMNSDYDISGRSFSSIDVLDSGLYLESDSRAEGFRRNEDFGLRLRRTSIPLGFV